MSLKLALGKRGLEEGGADDLSRSLVTSHDPTCAASEAYRVLRTNLLYSLVDLPPKVIVTTSPGPHEGKSTTCANLAVVLTQAGKQVLLVDCDLRRPVVHKVFGLRNFRGLVSVLAGEHSLQDVSHEPLPGLKVVTVGPVPPNPAEHLGSRRFAELLDGARAEFDYVLLDAPPTELVTDPAIVSTQSDGVLLVLDAQSTRKGAVRQAMRSLEGVGANVIGTVMNNVKASRGGYYGYGHEY
jgi:capsular exopolysaccharide synthesis family protein